MPFRDTAGHSRVKALLAGVIAAGTVPPTLLFAGPDGVGKHRVARATAAALNCLSPLTNLSDISIDACGECRACRRIADDKHVDVLRLEPDETGKIKVDEVREMLARTGFRPFEGKRRVVIIRDADGLVEQAQNALLKSLEEPPPSTVFILTTAVPDALLSTVRSRCMRLRFGRVAESEVALVLQRDHDVAAAVAANAAALADGSVGRALAIGANDLDELRTLALQLLQQAARGSVVAPRLQAAATLVRRTRTDDRTREEIGLILRFVSSMLRDIELLNGGGDVRALANGAIKDELARLARAFSGDRARDAFAHVDRAIDALRRNVGPKVVTEWLATQI